MREHIVALVAASARAAASQLVEQAADRRVVAQRVMRSAFEHFMAPETGEAFAGACAALYELYPDDDDLRQEVEAIGARNRVFLALESGVPVDFDSIHLPELPAEQLGLVELMRAEAKRGWRGARP